MTFNLSMKHILFPFSLIIAVICCVVFSISALFILSAPIYANDEIADTAAASEASTADTASTPYELHGSLSVSNAHLTDQYGQIFQLRGVSTDNLAQFPEYVSEESFRTLRDDWNVNTVRLAMHTAGENGYCLSNQSTQQTYRELILSGVQAASSLGLYVIIDWHTLSDNDPNTYKEQALSFFSDLSAQLSDYKNVIYEICNEPNSGTSWEQISNYAVGVIDAIRVNSPDSVIIVGTPTWCQDINVAAQQPISRSNLLYSIHFHANTHKQELRQKTQTAISAGLPVIVSEFNINDSSGGANINIEEGDRWLSMLDYYQIGYIISSLSNSEESSALLNSSCTSLSNWLFEDLTSSAQWFVSHMTGIVPLPPYEEAETSPYLSAQCWAIADTATINATVTANWSDGTSQFCEYSFQITNTAEQPINNWRLHLVWSQEPTLGGNWECQVGTSGSNWLIVPMDYNTVISSGSSVSFGLIVSGSTVPYPIDVTLE